MKQRSFVCRLPVSIPQMESTCHTVPPSPVKHPSQHHLPNPSLRRATTTRPSYQYTSKPIHPDVLSYGIIIIIDKNTGPDRYITFPCIVIIHFQILFACFARRSLDQPSTLDPRTRTRTRFPFINIPEFSDSSLHFFRVFQFRIPNSSSNSPASIHPILSHSYRPTDQPPYS
jgi:hypothetical protein